MKSPGDQKMWLDKCPTKESTDQIPLLRPKANSQVRAELTGQPMKVFVHFAVNRSWPCTGHKCSLCKRQIAKRFYAYYPVIGKSGAVAILELTSLAEASLISQMEPFSHEPCGTVTVSRPPGKRNMPCTVKWEEPNGDEERTSATLTETDLKNALMRIWKLPSPNGEITNTEYLEKLNESIRLRTTKNS